MTRPAAHMPMNVCQSESANERANGELAAQFPFPRLSFTVDGDGTLDTIYIESTSRFRSTKTYESTHVNAVRFCPGTSNKD
ncbi:unnamed protein product [Nippostrongylus brasiliensis]|uniref:Transposase n=1 Tax=Nippostrongylus brasiliensis TaxID=27835 RepID=A0A0N4Y144_NIPBR|nr:unnamed protein product [Nippostrongylus brasiliensis]